MLLRTRWKGEFYADCHGDNGIMGQWIGAGTRLGVYCYARFLETSVHEERKQKTGGKLEIYAGMMVM